MNKILVLANLNKKSYEIFEKESDLTVVNATSYNDEKIDSELLDTKVLIVNTSIKIDADFLNKANVLNAIVCAGVSTQNIDIKECSSRSIIVMNIPNANSVSASELTFNHILNASKNFINNANSLKIDKVWNTDYLGTELKNKKLGVIGFGATGKKVSKLGKAFDMDVIVYDPHVSSSVATNMGVDYTIFFNDILKCDFITIHTPKNEKTTNIITKKEIEKMKDGVVLINVCHGGLYNEDDLFDALESAKISFLGIDTFNDEPALSSKLLNLENVSATPHIKSNTKEVKDKISLSSTKQAILAARNISYLNPVNLPLDTTSLPSFMRPYIELTQKLASLCAQSGKGSLRAIQLNAEGEIGEYLNFLMPIALTGVMKHNLGDEVNYLNAELVAQKNNITFDYSSKPNSSAYKNKLTVIVTNTNSTTQASGTIFDDEISKIIDINNIPLEISPEGKMLIFANKDIPGVIAQISQILFDNNINIADFRLGRDGKDNALAIVLVDDKLNDNLLETINSCDSCIWAKYVEL